MSSDLFRKAVLERLSTPEQLDQALVLTPSASRAALWSAVAVVVLLLVASVVISVPIMARGVGIILSPDGVSDIVAQHAGRVRRLLAQPGAPVAVGQVVAELVQPDLENAMATLKAERADVMMQRARVSAFQDKEEAVQALGRAQRRQELLQRAQSTRQRIAWLEDRLRQEEQLVNNKFLSRNKLQDTQTEHLQTVDRLAETESQLRALEVENTSLRHGRARETLDLDLRLASVDHRIEELAKKLQRESQAVSPHAGVVAEVKISVGDLISPGQALLALVPAGAGQGGALTTVAYLAPGEGKKVVAGMAGRISPKSVKKEEFGTVLSRVLSVSPFPTTPEAMQRTLRNRQLVQTLALNDSPIEIMMTLETDPGTPSGLRWTSRGPDQKIGPGSTVEVEVIVKRMRLLVLVLPALERWLSVSPHSPGVWPFE